MAASGKCDVCGSPRVRLLVGRGHGGGRMQFRCERYDGISRGQESRRDAVALSGAGRKSGARNCASLPASDPGPRRGDMSSAEVWSEFVGTHGSLLAPSFFSEVDGGEGEREEEKEDEGEFWKDDRDFFRRWCKAFKKKEA